MASYGTVEYYQEEVEKTKQRLALIEEGGKSVIYKMAVGGEYDFKKIRQICDQIESAEFVVQMNEKELQEAKEKAKQNA